MQTILLGHALFNPYNGKYVDVRPRDTQSNVSVDRKYDGTVWLNKFQTRMPEPENARQNPDRFAMVLQYNKQRTIRQQKALAKRLTYDPFRDGYYQQLAPDCLYTDEPVQYFETRNDVRDLIQEAFGTSYETLGFEIRRVSPHSITGYYE
jgi:hypothetical protein